MSPSHQSRPNQMRGRILASGASSQSSAALACNLLRTVNEVRFARLLGKLPSNEAQVQHIHQFLVRQWRLFFLVATSIRCSQKSSPFSQNLSRPRVGVHGILCALRHPDTPKRAVPVWNSKYVYSALKFLFFLEKAALLQESQSPRYKPSPFPSQYTSSNTNIHRLHNSGKALWQIPTDPYSHKTGTLSSCFSR